MECRSSRSSARARRLTTLLGTVFLWGFLVVLLGPAVVLGWGTVTGGANLSADEREDLRKLFVTFGVNSTTSLAELDDRLGPHPVHQFVVQQALLLLKDDPAFADAEGAAFPTVTGVNSWDGLDRCDKGMRQRQGKGLVDIPALAPTDPATTHGPSPDAELDQKMGYNPEFNGRAHYWNPWLDAGEAPKAAGANYSRLVFGLLDGESAGDLAHYTAYLAHYVADPLSSKHADAFPLEAADVTALNATASKWFLEPTDDLEVWLASGNVTAAITIMEARVAALGPSAQSAWLARLSGRLPQIGSSTLLQRGSFWTANLAASSLRTAVACYLHELHVRPAGKDLSQFYQYFDAFFFNGPIYKTVIGNPSFALCTAVSEHLMWETNPAQYAKVKAESAKPKAMLTGKKPRELYMPWKPAPGQDSLDAEVARKGYEASLAELVKSCASAVHGDVGSAVDFEANPDRPLELTIRCVYTALRAGLTGLRADAWGRRVEGNRNVNVQVEVTNLADRPATLSGLRVSIRDRATKRLDTRPGWTVPLSGIVVDKEPVSVGIGFEGVPETVEVTDLVVDLRGTYAEVPDRGWVRTNVAARDTRIVHGAAPKVATKGPIDVVVVLDTTGSMQSSINSMRENAIASIRKLHEKTADIRLAIVTFRDLDTDEEDRAQFRVAPFSRDLETQFAFLNGMVAKGGGDTPEDQLHGVSLGLKLWESETPDPERVPAKIIVVITDAPAKSPDKLGNSLESIAARAKAVDPAHVYPIVVGTDRYAQRDATELARLTDGKVLSAAGGDEVARVVLEAVGTAVERHAVEAPPPRAGLPRWLLGVLAAVTGALGIYLITLATHLARRSRRAAGKRGWSAGTSWAAAGAALATATTAGLGIAAFVATGEDGGIAVSIVAHGGGDLAPVRGPTWDPAALAGPRWEVDASGSVIELPAKGVRTKAELIAEVQAPAPVMREAFPPAPPVAPGVNPFATGRPSLLRFVPPDATLVIALDGEPVRASAALRRLAAGLLGASGLAPLVEPLGASAGLKVLETGRSLVFASTEAAPGEGLLVGVAGDYDLAAARTVVAGAHPDATAREEQDVKALLWPGGGAALVPGMVFVGGRPTLEHALDGPLRRGLAASGPLAGPVRALASAGGYVAARITGKLADDLRGTDPDLGGAVTFTLRIDLDAGALVLGGDLLCADEAAARRLAAKLEAARAGDGPAARLLAALTFDVAGGDLHLAGRLDETQAAALLDALGTP